jgi:glucosyl-3-phosphoglycerate synthase
MPPARTAARPARRSTRVRRPRVPEPARVSVVIPVLNESRTIADVVRFALDDPHVGEVLVVDDGSHDGTPELAESAGARVITSSMLGKGASMEDGMRAAKHDIVLYLDGDLHGLTPGLVTTMAQPLVAGYGDLVKARFARTAGRVTVLTARPLLRTYFPELSGLNQPLGGIMAARRSLLEQLRFENDYGVDIGLLIDAAARGARIVEVDIGRLEHDSQSLDALGQMAVEVARTIVERAAEWGRLQVSFVRDTHERARRQRATSMGSLLSVVRGTDRLALFDMDGTLLDGRFVVELARQTRRAGRLARLLDSPELDPLTRTRQIAALFRGVSKYTFMQVAREMPLTAGAIDAVVGLRRKGYVVGLRGFLHRPRDAFPQRPGHRRGHPGAVDAAPHRVRGTSPLQAERPQALHRTGGCAREERAGGGRQRQRHLHAEGGGPVGGVSAEDAGGGGGRDTRGDRHAGRGGWTRVGRLAHARAGARRFAARGAPLAPRRPLWRVAVLVAGDRHELRHGQRRRVAADAAFDPGQQRFAR